MGFLIAAVIFGWLGAMIWLASTAMENESWPHGLLAIALLVGGLGLILQARIETEKEGPCLRYETGQMWNGQFMQTYRLCVERGEWLQ